MGDLRQRSALLTKARGARGGRVSRGRVRPGSASARVLSHPPAQAARKYRDALNDVAEAERTFAHALGTFGAGGRPDADEARASAARAGEPSPNAAARLAAPPRCARSRA